MALPTVIDFEPENDFGGSIGQQQSRFLTFLAHVAPDPDDGIDGAVDALYAYDSNYQRGAEYPGNPDLRVDDFGADLAAKGVNRNGHYLFRVVVSYASGQIVTVQNDEKVLAENPLEDPPAWRSSFRVEMVPATEDIEGKPIVNKAGDYYDPPPMRKKVIWTHACTVNVASLPSEITSYANAVNNAPCTVRGIACAEETVNIVGMDIPDSQSRGGVEFIPFTLAYEVDEDGFDLKLLNQGYRGKNAIGQQYDIMVDPPDEYKSENPDWKPQRTSVPCMLDEDGEYIKNPTLETIVFNDHEVTYKLNFAGLPGIGAIE